MQLLVVAAILPSLLIMSRANLYAFLRISSGLMAAFASVA